MFLSFGKSLKLMGGFRLRVGTRLKSPVGIFLLMFAGIFYMIWYSLILGGWALYYTLLFMWWMCKNLNKTAVFFISKCTGKELQDAPPSGCMVWGVAVLFWPVSLGVLFYKKAPINCSDNIKKVMAVCLSLALIFMASMCSASNVSDTESTYNSGSSSAVVLATEEPTLEPTPEPTLEPTTEPTIEPTQTITVTPTEEPTAVPTVESIIAATQEPTEQLVWIPTNGGTKYHSKSTCSSMIDPMQVTISEAIALNFDPCGRCY